MADISVVIPAYNQGRYLGPAIESCLAGGIVQELIVVDDGSTDETPAVCAQYATEIVYVRQANRGVSAARNRGLKDVTADWVTFLDADDLIESGWFACVSEAVRSGDRGDVIYGDYVLFDDDGRYSLTIRPPRISVRGLLSDAGLLPSGAVVRRATLDEVGGFREGLEVVEDWDMWLRLALAGASFMHLPAVSVRHREHREGASKRRIHALERQIELLRLWSVDGRLSPAQRRTVEHEVARRVVRIGRAVWPDREAFVGHMRSAIEMDPRLTRHPLLVPLLLAPVGPYFGVSAHPEQRPPSAVEDALGLTAAIAEAAALAGVHADARALRASRFLGVSASHVVAGRVGPAVVNVARAISTDPSIVIRSVTSEPSVLRELKRVWPWIRDPARRVRRRIIGRWPFISSRRADDRATSRMEE